MMGTSTKRYQWLFLATLVLTLYYRAGYAQSSSFGSTYVPTGGEMAIYGQHDFQSGSGTINAGIVGSERQPTIGLFSFVSPNGNWVNVANNAFVDGYVRTYRTSAFTFPIGDNNVYRPAAVSTAGSTTATAATAAYYGVNPGTATTSNLNGSTYGTLPVGGPFSTTAVATPGLLVDNTEYWDIDGPTPARITLTWDANSPINAMTSGVLSKLTLVGWNPTTAKWEVIPSVFDATSLLQTSSTSVFTGPASTTASGSITTLAPIVPNTYTVYTLAGTTNCPTITNVAANNVNPSTCGGVNGSLLICGVTPLSSYTISYSKNSLLQTDAILVANATGCLSLTGLGAGTYNGIQVRNASCLTGSNVLGPITLVDPGSLSAPTLAVNPASSTICSGQSVTLVASGSAGATFTFTGPGLTPTNSATLVVAPTTAGQVVYSVTQSLSGCLSSAASQTLVVTAQPVISSVSPTNPTACGTSTGAITLNGFNPSGLYTVSYVKDNGSPITGIVTANASGQLVLSSLAAGNYTTILVNQGNCTSGPFSGTITLTDPAPNALTAAQLASFSPTSCGTATGRIEITGLPATTSNITIGYAKNGTLTSAIVSTDASGKASILGLTAGSYTTFTVKIGACTSSPYAGPVTISDPGLTVLTAANISNTNPTSCGNNDARITLTGLPSLTTMTVTYQLSGTSLTANVTTDASGQAVIPNLRAGNYSVIAYTIGACTSAPYTGAVTISDPGVIPLTAANVVGINPAYCGAANGRVEISGLASNQSVTINYKKDGVAQAPVTAITNASGVAIIGSLGQGLYTDFSYTIGACTSNVYTGSVDLRQPVLTAAQVTGYNPAICGSSTGRIEITGLASNQSMTINYTQNGIQKAISVTTDATGKALLGGLGAGTYVNFSYSQGACSSTAYPGPVTLTNPTPTVLTSANVLGINPSVCGNSDGRIELTGLAGSTSTTITYRRNGIPATVTVTTDPSGKAVVGTLLAGAYSDFTYTQGSCTSTAFIGPVTLSNPTPTPLTAANVVAYNPTNCTATNGRIEITGLASNATTTLSFTKDGVAQTTSLISDNSGKVIISNLPTGQYSNFSYSQGACLSAPYTGTLTITTAGCNRISVRVYLQGALFSNGGALSVANTPLMRDNLRSNGYLPLNDPYRTATYTAAFPQVNNAEFQSIPASMTATTGDKAIVDWVFIELRDKTNPAIVSYTRSGLLLRDGTVIDTDGQAGLNFTGFPVDNYYVAIRHRNHMGIMTAQPIAVPSTTTVDFITMSDAQIWNSSGYDGVERSTITASSVSVRALWAGNAVQNNKIKYNGSGTDLPGILSNVINYPGSGGAYNFSNAYGYFSGDVNMDGRALYIGAGNDGAFILSNELNFPLNSAKVYNYDLFLQQLP